MKRSLVKRVSEKVLACMVAALVLISNTQLIYADDTDAAGSEIDGTLYDKVDAYDTGEEFWYGIRADGGFLKWDSSKITFDNDNLSLWFERVTEGEEIEKYEAEFGGEAAIYSFGLYENGVSKTVDSEIHVGMNLKDDMMGFYGKVYRIEDDGALTEVKWTTENYLDGALGGFYVWQSYGITDDALETYVPGTYLVVAPHTFGDVNYDDTITVGDALEVLRMTVGLRTCDGLMEITADANGDGKVNASDALEILRYVVKLESSFPVWSKIPC